MKTRTGFVSNSSSSSFVIGIIKPSSTFAEFLLLQEKAFAQYLSGTPMRNEDAVDAVEGWGLYAQEIADRMREFDGDVTIMPVEQNDVAAYNLVWAAVEAGDIEVLHDAEM